MERVGGFRQALFSGGSFRKCASGRHGYFRGGTYKVEKYGKPYQGSLGPANSGTKDMPITFAAYPGEKVLFKGKAKLGGQGRKINYHSGWFPLQ